MVGYGHMGGKRPLVLFGTRDSNVRPDDPMCVLTGPQGEPSLLREVQWTDGNESQGMDRPGQVRVYNLPLPGLTTDPPNVGSHNLATAVRGHDLASVLETLAFDIVIVPVVKTEDGMTTRLFPAGDDAPDTYDLCVFSTIESLRRFIGETGEELFAVQYGVAMADYVARHQDVLDMIIIDPGGPYSMTLSAHTLSLLLDEDYQDGIDGIDILVSG